MKWGNLKLGRWPPDGMMMTLAGVAVVLYIGIGQLAGKVPAHAVLGGAAAGAVMMYLIDCGNWWPKLATSDKARFLALMGVAYVSGSVLGSVLLGSSSIV